MTHEISCTKFGYAAGEEVFLYELNNGNMEATISNYGCTIVAINVADSLGIKKNIVAGFDNLDQYLQLHPYFGCVVGRYANRIAYGKFSIDGNDYQLPVNNGNNHLHGGIEGFNRKVWKTVRLIEEEHRVGVCFSYISKDGEEGYPGNLQVSVTYSLSNKNELRIKYLATTDKATIVNLTNHTYFNLTGFEDPTIYQHRLQIFSDSYTGKNENNVPSGENVPVKNTPFDFSSPTFLGTNIRELKEDKGYDHNFILKKADKAIALAVELSEPRSGRVVKLFTDQPGMQLYTANWFDKSLTGAQNKPYQQHSAVALETQSFPDAPNHPGFPNTVLRRGETYHTETVYQFLVRRE